VYGAVESVAVLWRLRSHRGIIIIIMGAHARCSTKAVVTTTISLRFDGRLTAVGLPVRGR